MRWVVALILVLSVVACGGGSGDADPTSTPRQRASPTSRVASPIATAVQGSPSGASATQQSSGGGGSGAAATRTTDTSGPTPTRRPVTVVTTPKPIARRTPTAGIAPATATPASAFGNGSFQIISEHTFDEDTTMYLGTTDFGTVIQLYEGWYEIDVADQSWQTVVDDSIEMGSDGLIQTDVALTGNGAAGLIARSFQNDAGEFSYYVCWITTDSEAGCHVSIAGEWTELQRTTVTLAEVNRLTLIAIGTSLYFELNDEPILDMQENSIELGYWGVYAESFSDVTSAFFDTLTIAAWVAE